MSGYMVAEVWCEVCLDREVAEDTGTLRDHRADLRQYGWRRWRDAAKGLIDVCPDCVDKVWAWHIDTRNEVSDFGSYERP